MTSVTTSPVRSLVELTKPRAGEVGVWTLRVLALLGLALGCTGVLSEVLFTQQSSSKWAVTVAGPLVVLGLCLSRRPVTYLAVAVVVVLPFLQVAVSFKGLSVPLALPVLVAAVVVASLATPADRPGRSTSLVRTSGLVAVLLLLPWALRGTAPWMWVVQIVVVAAVGYVVSRAWALDPDAGALVLPALAGTLALQGLLALQEFQTGRPLDFYGGQSGYGSAYFFSYGDVFRPSGSFYDPISLGNVLALGLPLLLVLSSDTRAGVLKRCWYGACAIVVAGALLLTFSRMSWIGAASGLLLVLLLSPAADRFRQIAFLAVSSVVVLTVTAALAGASLTQRLQSILDPTATGVRTAQGDETREQLWGVAARVFSDHPIVGVGRGELNRVLVARVGDSGIFTHAHSTYLQLLAESGVLGGAALGVLALAVAVELTRRWRANNGLDVLARGCAGAVVAVAVVWSTDYTVRFTGVFVCMALPFILLHATRHRAPFPTAPSLLLDGTGRPAPRGAVTTGRTRQDESVGGRP